MDFTTLTQKQIGERISKCRKMKGLSQEDLARLIEISRPSLTQLELGNRSLNIREFQRLSFVLGFSADEFLSEDFLAAEKLAHAAVDVPPGMVRTPDFSFQEDKFRNVILYMLERCAGKPNVGETVLCKMLYFSDFNYYQRYREHLTGATYRKLTYGPVPRKFDVILRQMISRNELQQLKCKYRGYSQTRYMPLQKADLTLFKASEKEVIDKVIDQISDWSASAISAYSHKDVPWVASRHGADIDYALAFQREPPFSVV